MRYWSLLWRADTHNYRSNVVIASSLWSLKKQSCNLCSYQMCPRSLIQNFPSHLGALIYISSLEWNNPSHRLDLVTEFARIVSAGTWSHLQCLTIDFGFRDWDLYTTSLRWIVILSIHFFPLDENLWQCFAPTLWLSRNQELEVAVWGAPKGTTREFLSCPLLKELSGLLHRWSFGHPS